MTKKHNDDCKRLLRLMGVPIVQVSLILSSISCFKYFCILPHSFLIDVLFQWRGDLVEHTESFAHKEVTAGLPHEKKTSLAYTVPAWDKSASNLSCPK